MRALAREFVVWTPILILTASLSVRKSFGPANVRGTLPAGSVKEGVVKLADSNIEYFSQGEGAPIVLLPFGSLTVGYLERLSQSGPVNIDTLLEIVWRACWLPTTQS
jgi:hypothetical protein